ncbi:putative Ig domain-containing protein, partial [Candidatus Sumerlaeota bacterium]|nr:putative Ig domain-containing protein [Candidatus Sumerlaeota bacterium]
TLSRNNPYYILPFPGLFHPVETYFWRVKSVNEAGLVSDWSNVWEFTPEFPDYPRNLRYEIQDDEIFLTWDAGSKGTPPRYFRIYGINVYGFVPYDHPHVLEGFATTDKPTMTWIDYSVTDWKAYPTNCMKQLEKKKLFFFHLGENKARVVSPQSKYPNMNRIYYRVVAVDKWGSQSAPSEFITLPEGFIYSPSEIMWEKNGLFTYKIRRLKYMGQITSKDPYFAGLWDQPVYSYSSDNLPEGLTINRENGYITGTPVLENGTNRFSFSVKIIKNNNILTEKIISVTIGES